MVALLILTRVQLTLYEKKGVSELKFVKKRSSLGVWAGLIDATIGLDVFGKGSSIVWYPVDNICSLAKSVPGRRVTTTLKLEKLVEPDYSSRLFRQRRYLY